LADFGVGAVSGAFRRTCVPPSPWIHISKLISLWEMLDTYADLFTQTECALRRIELECVLKQGGYSREITPNPAVLIDDEKLGDLIHWLGRIATQCDELALVDQKELVQNIFLKLNVDRSCETLRNQLGMLRESIQDALKRRWFLWVPPDRLDYYYNENLFGPEVRDKFPDGVVDIVESGNCYALGRSTACVFHLMRVIPYGMQSVAKKLKVKYPRPIICLDWGGIIQPIDKAVRLLGQLARTKKRIEDQKYYSEIVSHLYYCKDAWRNHVSHAREPYDMPQAQSVMEHVRWVMRLLASGK
jgi:hypothetical protein